MSALVPHHRPELEDKIRVGQPVSADQWATLGGLSNWIHGHGSMLIPWSAIGYRFASSVTRTLRFYVAPKIATVERVWCIHAKALQAGVTLTITAGTAAAVTVPLATTRSDRDGPFVIREPLSAKSSTAAELTVSFSATGGAAGNTVLIESIACYEQTRKILARDTTDYGVDLSTIRPRQPIADFANQSASGVMDAYDALDARRTGFFYWSTATNDAVEITSGSLVDLFDLYPNVVPARTTVSATSVGLTVAVYCRSVGGDGELSVSTIEVGDVQTATITTSWAWVAVTVDALSEDLSDAAGLPGGVREAVNVQARVTTATSVEIAGVSIYRATKPL